MSITANLRAALDVIEGGTFFLSYINHLKIKTYILVKFLLSLPPEEINMTTPERVFFHIETAHWFYEVY